MKVVTKTVPINFNILNDIKQIAKRDGKTEDELITEIINNTLNKEVKNLKNESMDEKVKRLSKGRLRVVKPKLPKEFLEEYKNLKTEDLIGIGTVPRDEQPFDVVKAVNDVRISKE